MIGFQILDRQQIDGHTPRFSKGPLIPAGGKLSNDPNESMNGTMVNQQQPLQTSSIVTELHTSMTYKILSNAIVGAQVKAARQQGAIPSQVVQLLNTVFPEDLVGLANVVVM